MFFILTVGAVACRGGGSVNSTRVTFEHFVVVNVEGSFLLGLLVGICRSVGGVDVSGGGGDRSCGDGVRNRSMVGTCRLEFAGLSEIIPLVRSTGYTISGIVANLCIGGEGGIMCGCLLD